MEYSLLGSGSSGNATLIRHGNGALLVDNGYSLKQFLSRTSQLSFPVSNLGAIFITHEHSDHTAGLGVLTRKYDIPVYMTEGTYANLGKRVGRIPTVRRFRSGDVLEAAGFTVGSFSVPHDAAEPVGYTICQNGKKIGIATDMGHAPELVKHHLRGCTTLLLECNYDTDMLTTSDYPAVLRKRIRGNKGHLGNRQSALLLKAVLGPQLRTVVATHLSEKNNTPELVREALEKEMEMEGAVRRLVGLDGIPLQIASQDVPTDFREA